MPAARQSTYLKGVGANVRRIRIDRGLSQEKLAELVELNVRNIQRIEAGQITILVTTAKRLRDALKCEWPDILGT